MSGVIAGIVVGGVAALTGLAGMGIGLGKAAKQRRKASQAEADSKRLMQRARSQIQKDAMQNLKLPLESYERAFKANTAQQQQAIESLQGADARTLAAGIGKVGAVGVGANEEQRLNMGEALYGLEKTKAESANKVRDELVGMDVGAARDLLGMAADEQQASAASTMSAIQSGVAGVSALASSMPDYMAGAGDRRAGKLAETGAYKPDNPKIGQVPDMRTDVDQQSPTYGQKIPKREVYYPGAPLEGDEGYIPIGEREGMKETDTGFIEGKTRNLQRNRTEREIEDILAAQGYTRKQIKEMIEGKAFDYTIFK